jgi:hypothetical protein
MRLYIASVLLYLIFVFTIIIIYSICGLMFESSLVRNKKKSGIHWKVTGRFMDVN